MYEALQKHLILWQLRGHISWLEIGAGEEGERTLHHYLRQADLVLLLMSSDFFATNSCYKAMNSALQEQKERQIPVVPILARPSAWEESACGNLQVLPGNEQPITLWPFPEQAYENIRIGLEHYLNSSEVALSVPLRPKLFQARDLPKGYIARPKAFEAIKQLLLDRQRRGPTAISTALHGAGGFGKTTLALALCHDPEIQAAFPDGILWVELGEHPPRPLDILNGLLTSLETAHTDAITMEAGRDRWRAALAECEYLLVIDDVWQASALNPLLEGNPQCARLITTRNDQVLPDDTARVWVDAMEPEEALLVLRRGLPEEIHQPVQKPRLELLIKQLGYWPLLLALANGMLLVQIRHRRDPDQALSILEEAYQTHGVMAFHLGNATERQQAADACVDVSLRHLEEFTLARYHAVERYQELAVFPEETDIPLATLKIFWQATGGLSSWEVEELCMHLHGLSLLFLCDLAHGIIRMHDVLRSYLVQRSGQNLPSLHARFLEANQQAAGLTRWADLPQSDPYLWEHLIFHLQQAGQAQTLYATLTDLHYLARKALYCGIASVELDLLRANSSSVNASLNQTRSVRNPTQEIFAHLHQIIVRQSHLLRQVRMLNEMSGLLLSHVCWEEPFVTNRLALEQSLPVPSLTTWHPLPIGASRALRRTFSGHDSSVTSCAVSPDGSWIVSTAVDGTLKIWNARTGEQRLSFQSRDSLTTSCAVSPDGAWIVSSAGSLTASRAEKRLKVWDTQTGQERLSLRGHTSWVTSCAVSPDGTWIVSASLDQTLKVWDAQTGQERLSLRGHTGPINSCAVSPGGSWIVSASDDRTLKVWDARTGEERLSLRGHTGPINSCAVSPDGAWIVSASLHGTLRVWDARTGEQLFSLSSHTGSVTNCAISPDGTWIVSASDDRTLKVWDARTGAERFSLHGHTGPINSCAVSPDGAWIVSASDDRTLKVWDTSTEKEHPLPGGHRYPAMDCAVSPDGAWVVTASRDRTLKVWDMHTGKERLSLPGHFNSVLGCAVSPDGAWIVSASWDDTLKLWDAQTGEERLSLQGHEGLVNSCAVSPDGEWIISASHDRTLKIWDMRTGQEHRSLQGHTDSVTSCAVSPDGSWIVSASRDQTLKVWDSSTGEERSSLRGHTGSVRACAVSPDGEWIVSASDDRTLKVWNTRTGKERFSLRGHFEQVASCAVSPDGGWIVSASHDRSLKVWESQTGLCVLTFPADGPFYGCAFHPDGNHLVACGELGVYFLHLVQ